MEDIIIITPEVLSKKEPQLKIIGRGIYFNKAAVQLLKIDKDFRYSLVIKEYELFLKIEINKGFHVIMQSGSEIGTRTSKILRYLSAYKIGDGKNILRYSIGIIKDGLYPLTPITDKEK